MARRAAERGASVNEAHGGVRRVSAAEAQRLVEAGRVHVLDVRTPEEYARLGHIPGALLLPAPMIAAAAAELPRDGRPVLVHCEHGVRSAPAARWLARAVAALGEAAGRLGLDLRADVLDLEAAEADLGTSVADVVLVFRYLHRPLFPALVRALRTGGVLVYETFTVDQAAHGRPRDRRFLLGRGELPALVAPLEVVRQREGEFEGKMLAGVVAVKR